MKWIKRSLFVLLLISGSISLFMLMLAFTDLPYNAYHDLAVRKDTLTTPPEAIVIMGGDGMPSPNTLIRLYHGAEAANEFNKAKVILAMPYNKGAADSLRQLKLMAKELQSKGVNRQRILFEPWGYNTHTQSKQISKMLDHDTPLLIISSPEHMYRALASFRKVGFNNVGGMAGFEVPSDEERLKKKDEDEDEDEDVQNLNLRYNMWSYLQYEIIVMREYAAISYYWFKGWI
jgi:uncharacterized SAM-binding protein YcdF (DUF218 family)